ncbi:hypothetical protein JCM16358_21920 [Halanaerocella petrolearia]
MKKLTVVIFIMCLLLTACSSQNNTDQNQIKIMHWLGSGLKDRTESINIKEIEVSRIVAPKKFYMKKLLILYGADDEPDLFLIPAEEFKVLASQGGLAKVPTDKLPGKAIKYKGTSYGIKKGDLIYVVAKDTKHYDKALQVLKKLL